MNHATYKAAMRLAGARGGASRSPRKLEALARARQVRLDRIAARRAAGAVAACTEALQWTAISVGMRVEAGAGEDHDTGTVNTIDVRTGVATVRWDSGVVTPCPVANLVRLGEALQTGTVKASEEI